MSKILNYLFLSSFLGLLIGLSNLRAQDPIPESKPDTLVQVFTESFLQQEVVGLKSLLSPVHLYPLISPREAEGKTSQELEAMAERVEDRILEKFSQLARESQENKVKLKELAFRDYEIEALGLESDLSLFFLNVHFKGAKKDYTISLLSIFFEEQWYLLDLPKSSGVFD